MLSRKNFWSIVFVLALSSPVGNVWALTSPSDVSSLDCDVQPTCESLNYSKTADPDCEVGGYVYCPFDSSYMKCVLKKPKIDDVCEGFKLAECPENANCYTCESETATKYTFESCKEGFTHLNNLCVAIHDTCEGAGYRTTNEGGFCKSTAMITISDGTEKTCYADCCTYLAQETCEQANPNSKCTADEIGCFVASACKTGFYKEANDVTCAGAQYTTIGGADANGCGYCATEFTTCEEAGYYTTTSAANAACAAAAPEPWPVYMADGQVGACVSCGFAWCEENEKSKTRCEEVYANSVCSPNSSGCFKPTACKVGFYADKTGCGQDLGLAMANATLVKLDGNGCGECQFIEKTCAELSNDMHGVNDLDGLVCASSANINLAGVYSTCHYDCEVKISCQYYDEASCVSENGNSICTESSDGCWGATACKVGFYTEANDINCPRGDYSKIGGVDANGCGFCATEYESCKAAGFADEPIANGVEHPMYLADGSFERFCMAPATKEACEDAFFNSKCVETEEGEWKADGCEKESATSCPGMSYTDMAGCRTCTIDYNDKATCEALNENSVCKEQEDGSFEPSSCEAGFSNTCDVRVNADKNGCGVCCDYGSETICEKQNANADCTQQNGACWIVTGCADKYKLENGACVASQTCEDFGFLTSDATCSTLAEPESVTLASGSTITCFSCGVGCDYYSVYECETQNANAICETNDALCPVVIGCKTGYALMNGVCQKTYDGQNACENANPGMVCEPAGEGGYSNSMYAPTGECKEGYSLKDGACVANCQYADAQACYEANYNSNCDTIGDCWVPTDCTHGATKDGNPAGCAVSYGYTYYYDGTKSDADANGCVTCYSNYTSCEDLGYISDYMYHVGGFEDQEKQYGPGKAFGFWDKNGMGHECWVPEGTCAYETLADCQKDTSVDKCAQQAACYVAESCAPGFVPQDGKCIEDIPTFATETECLAANPGLACAFDTEKNKYVTVSKCDDGGYLTQAECEGVFANTTCARRTLPTALDNCFIPSACKTGYFKNTNNSVDCGDRSEIGVSGINSSLWIFMADPFGCGQCQYKFTSCTEIGMMDPASLADFNCTISGEFKLTTGESRTCWKSCVPKAGQWTSAAECEAANPGSVCEIASVSGGTIYYLPSTTCKDGYTLTEGACVKDVVPHSTPTACENANPNSTCANTGTSLGYQPNGCKEGYFASAEDCPGEAEGIRDADDGGCGVCSYTNYSTCYALGGTYSDYSEEESVFYGCTDSLTAYVKNNLKTCYTNCVIPHPGGEEGSFSCDYANEEVCEVMNKGSTCAYKDGCYVVVNCQAGEYATEAECQTAKEGYKCVQNANGCYETDGCLAAYNEQWHVSSAGSQGCWCFFNDLEDCENRVLGGKCTVDGNGCAVLDATTCTLKTEAACLAQYGNATCAEEYVDDNGNACWGISRCNDGYSLIDDKCVKLYTSAAECEKTGFVCEYVGGGYGTGSYAPTDTCRAGYTLTNGECVSNCPAGEYTTDEECSAAYPNSACGPTMDGCFGPDFCATGFTRAGNCPYGTLLNPDAAGCGVCAYTSGVQCTVHSNGFACESDGNGYYVPSTDTCASGYKLENGGCVPLTCEAGSYSSIAECEAQHPGYECEETVDLSSGAQGHSGGGN